MKSSLFSFIFGGLVLTVILQAILFASTGMQANRQQKQLNEVSIKLDKIQTYIDSTQKMITKINSFIDEPLPADSTSSDILNSNDLLSPEKLNETLGI